MNVHVHKNKATSRRSGQRRDVPESYLSNVVTFKRVIFSKSQCSRRCNFQCRNVTES